MFIQYDTLVEDIHTLHLTGIRLLLESLSVTEYQTPDSLHRSVIDISLVFENCVSVWVPVALLAAILIAKLIVITLHLARKIFPSY